MLGLRSLFSTLGPALLLVLKALVKSLVLTLVSLFVVVVVEVAANRVSNSSTIFTLKQSCYCQLIPTIKGLDVIDNTNNFCELSRPGGD